MRCEPVRVRRAGVGVLAAVGLLTAGCAAGQHAATSVEKPSIDGTETNIGSMQLRGLAVQAPATSTYYQTTSNALVTLVIANGGSADDTLTGVSSPAFGSWGTYPLSAVKGLAPGGQPQLQSDAAGGVKSVTIGGHSRASFGVPEATKALVLTTAKKTTYPGSTIPITFTFTKAGSKTVAVPVQLTNGPNESVIPGPSATGQEG